MIVYNKETGIIDAVVPNLDYSANYPEELRDKLVILEIDNPPRNIFDYRVVDNKLIKMTDTEVDELRFHGRLLSEEDRLENQMLNKLKPSYDEAQKAKTTIEILSLLQEVL